MLRIKILTVRLRPHNDALTAEQVRLAHLLAASEATKGNAGKESRSALRDLGREPFAGELRKILRRAGLEDPDSVYDERRYYFSGPMGRKLDALGKDCLERSAVHWLLSYRQVRDYEARSAAAQEGRRVPAERAHPMQPDESSWIEEKLRQLELRLNEATAVKSPNAKPRARTAAERLHQPCAQQRRNEGRDRSNAERKASADRLKAEIRTFAAEYLRKHANATKTEVAISFREMVERRWGAEDRQAAHDGEEQVKRKLPTPNTIRRHLSRGG